MTLASIVLSSILSAAPALEAEIRAVAALPGEPHIVAAAGVLKDESLVLTLENPEQGIKQSYFVTIKSGETTTRRLGLK